MSTGSAGLGGSGGLAGGGEALASGRFDPSQVYLWGTLEPGACYRDAIAAWSKPNEYVIGFPCGYAQDGTVVDLASIWIRPSDGRLLYLWNFQQYLVLAFVPDGENTSIVDYPNHTQANDLVVSTACSTASDFFADPTGGPVVYRCDDGNGSIAYYTESGAPYSVPSGYDLVHLGFEGSALLRASDGNWSVLAPSGQIVPLGRKFSTGTVRAHPSGFWAFASSMDGTRPVRWNIAADGTLAMDGAYPPAPPGSIPLGTAIGSDLHACAVEASGALLCFAYSGGLNDRIVRGTLGADQVEIVYDEATQPLVQIHLSQLFTGP